MSQNSTVNDNSAQPEVTPSVDGIPVDSLAATGQPVVARRSLVSRLPMTVFWALAAQAILSITRLLTSMTVGGRFGSGSEEQLGYYSSAFGVLMILVGLHEAFVTTPLTVFNQNRKDDQRSLFSGSMLITSVLVIGLIAAATGVLIAIQSGFQILKPELGAALVAAAALAPLQLLREFSRRWLLANLQVVASVWMEILFAACYLAALFGLVYAANVSAISVFVTIGSVNAFGLAIWWWIYRSEFQFASRSTTLQVSENFRYGRWVAGENVCSVLTMYMCVWVLTFAVDEAAAGVFFACFTVVLLANPFLLGIASILAPRAAQEFVRDGWVGLRKILLQYGILVVGVLACFSGFLFIFGDELTDFFFGPKYAQYFVDNFDGVNRITATLGLAMPLLGLSFVLTSGLLAANRPFESFYAAVVGLVILIVANLAFSDRTLETAARSFVVSIAGTMLCRLFFLIRAYRSESGRPAATEPSTT
ncbi:lipopolysaccharide biosynthesis protein [Planctomycetes bacterium K23_9]|uniref:MurJ-like flippase n=1 Tax=Stieleria marina TaxID=1930275 RepID=A0A517NP60_9BACT|nr:MurJ-like flippase [Planctomycetes bacterium K23_9]